MKNGIYEIISNEKIAPSVYEIKLKGDDETKAGQFVNIKLDGFYLRRPLSVCDAEGCVLTLIYKVVGKGTEALSKMKSGNLDLLTCLGNGFDLSACGEAAQLVGGGAGVPPMYLLAKRLIAAGIKTRVVLGFNAASEVFYEDKFKALGAETVVTTADGSYGVKGFVTAALKSDLYTYACGPIPMLKAVCEAAADGEFSFEERMGCGFGACMGCTCKTKYGAKRICKDGPVLKKGEIVW